MGANEQPENEVARGREEDKAPRPGGRLPDGGDEVPLFLRDKSDGRKGNAQDEKDEMAE